MIKSKINRAKSLIQQTIIVGGILASFSASAAPIDLTSWVVDNSFDFPAGQNAGNWVVSGGGTTVTQTVNGDPTLFLSPTSIGNIQGLTGTFSESTSDDDFVGFVFGFQNTSQFYLFDWKQGTQPSYGETALRGISLKRFDSTPTTHGQLWKTGDTAVSTLLHHEDLARSSNTTYTFGLDRNISTGDIAISISQGVNLLASFSVNDNTYGAGQFGFYNNSEGPVQYTGFEADVFQVPAPATLALFGLGLTILGMRRRKTEG